MIHDAELVDLEVLHDGKSLICAQNANLTIILGWDLLHEILCLVIDLHAVERVDLL